MQFTVTRAQTRSYRADVLLGILCQKAPASSTQERFVRFTTRGEKVIQCSMKDVCLSTDVPPKIFKVLLSFGGIDFFRC